jgi:hypothetical protein
MTQDKHHGCNNNKMRKQIVMANDKDAGRHISNRAWLTFIVFDFRVGILSAASRPAKINDFDPTSPLQLLLMYSSPPERKKWEHPWSVNAVTHVADAVILMSYSIPLPFVSSLA